MSNDELHEPLERLQAEIQKLGEDDAAIKRRMTRLVADLERKLESAEDSSDEPELIDNLRGNIDLFEVEHPRLTAVLNQIMAHLSNMGI